MRRKALTCRERRADEIARPQVQSPGLAPRHKQIPRGAPQRTMRLKPWSMSLIPYVHVSELPLSSHPPPPFPPSSPLEDAPHRLNPRDEGAQGVTGGVADICQAGASPEGRARAVSACPISALQQPSYNPRSSQGLARELWAVLRQACHFCLKVSVGSSRQETLLSATGLAQEPIGAAFDRRFRG